MKLKKFEIRGGPIWTGPGIYWGCGMMEELKIVNDLTVMKPKQTLNWQKLRRVWGKGIKR